MHSTREHTKDKRDKGARKRAGLSEERAEPQTAEKNRFKESLYKGDEMDGDGGPVPEAEAVELRGDISNKPRCKSKDLWAWIQAHRPVRYPSKDSKARAHLVDFIVSHPQCPETVKQWWGGAGRSAGEYPTCRHCKTAGCSERTCPLNNSGSSDITVPATASDDERVGGD